MSLTQEELKTLLEYNPETGLFKRHPPVHFNAYSDWWAGSLGTRGYRLIRYKGVYWKAHRLAWLYMTGEWPKGVIDHLDRDTNNNIWSNLRDVSQTENQYNAKAKTNKTGYSGVYFRGSRYSAMIGYKGKRLHLGSFASAQEASIVYENKKKELDDKSN
jgi:hypothetical protein